MLHLAWSFRPTPVYEYMSRTKQMEGQRKQEQEGGGDEKAGLPPAPGESLTGHRSRGPAEPGTRSCPPGSGSHGNEGGWRIYDNAGTRTWEQRCGAVSRPVSLTKAAWEMQFFGCVLKNPFENLSGPHWGFTVNSLPCGSSNAEESARLDKAFKRVQFYKSNVIQKKKK